MTDTKLGLKTRAVILRAKSRALRSMPILSRMSATMELGEELAGFLIDLADAIERITPYLDETLEAGGATPCESTAGGEGQGGELAAFDASGQGAAA